MERLIKVAVEDEIGRFTLPDGAGEVVLEDLGEHHMGARYIHIHLPFRIAGAATFLTTNGEAWLSSHTGVLMIRDACVILRYDLKRKSLDHFCPPSGWYIYGVEEKDDGFHLSLSKGSGARQITRVPFDGAGFETGPGPVKNGIMPSAFPNTGDNRIAPPAPTAQPTASGSGSQICVAVALVAIAIGTLFSALFHS